MFSLTLPKIPETLKVILEKLTLWVIFNVIVALLPFLFRAIGASFVRKPVSWETVLADGELLLVAAAIAAGAIGELVVKGEKLVIPRVIAGGGCVICLSLASLLYAFVRAQEGTPTPPDPSAVCNYSIGIFVSTFLAGTGCMILSEVREK